MENIIWSTACLKCPEYRAENDELVLRGELHTFVIYTCEDAGSDVLYAVEIMPFSGRIKMNGIGPEMICDVEISVMNTNVSAKPDSDGELRNIDVEMTLGLDIKVYEESMVKLLCDAYSVDGGLYIEKQKTAYDTLLIRNQNKFKIADRFEAKDMDILQIVHTYSSVNVEEIIPLSDGIKVEGVAVFDIVCVSGKDNSRFVCMTKQVPFSEKIDVEGMRDDSFYSVRAIVCGQQAIMQGMDEIEIKLSAVLDVLVLGRETVDVVTMAEYREENAVQKKRGRIVGKVITREENLWDIAKEYHTTVENIMEVNGLASENVGPGTRLIIL